MKKFGLFLLITMLFISGCSEDEEASAEDEEEISPVEESVEDDTNTEESTEDEQKAWWEEEVEAYQLEDLPRELEELEQELVLKEGMFSGDDYDFEEIKLLLDELPMDSSEEVLESAILQLIREDYHEEVEVFVKFDPTVDVQVESPDEDVDGPEQKISSSHFAILLDASGSMNADNGGKTRMDAAKEAITDFVDTLPEDSTISLRVYGHEGSGTEQDKKMSCEATEVIYNDKVNHEDFTKSLESVTPAGWTPIGFALEEAEKDIPEVASGAIVYVVSDGIETCDGDPVAAAKALTEKGIEPIINIIGFQVDDEARELLEEVAEAGNGTFTYAGNQQDLEQYWHDEYTRIQEAWEEWQQEGMKNAEEISNELMDLAEENGFSIMDKSELEFERAEELIDYLVKEREMEKAENLWMLFYDRSSAIWMYGYDNQSKNWLEAYDNGVEVWLHYYDTGVDKWTEYYNKMYR